jgi:hypothetical protein
MASNLAAAELLKEPTKSRPDRIETFLKKLSSGQAFDLLNGGQVKLKHTTHLEAILRKAQKNRGATNIKELDLMPMATIPAANGPVFLKNLKKSSEFGGGGAGANTAVQESANALYAAARFKTKSSSFQYTDETLEAALDRTDFGSFTETKKLLSSELDAHWQESCMKTADALYGKYGTSGKTYHFYRQNSWVKALEKKFSELNKKLDDEKFSQINKWTPADIWMVEKGFTWTNINDILTLNQELLTAIKEKSIIGVSLKLVAGNTARISEVNFTKKRPTVDYKGYSVDGRNNNFFANTNVQVSFSVDDRIQYRTFGDESNPNYSGEITEAGGAARHGKIGLGEISKFYRELTRDSAPQYDSIKKALNSPSSREKFFRDFHKYAKAISNDSSLTDYKKFYERAANHEGKLMFIFSKYIGVYILYHLLQKQLSDKTIMSQFIAKCYLSASSQTPLSAPFIKVF